jgi:hypothetical protein
MTILFSPWFWLALLISVLTLTGTGFHYGFKYAKADTAKERQAEQIMADEQAKKQAKADRETEEMFEEARETVRTVYIKVREKANENIINNPDYHECGLDADGLRLYNTKPDTTGADTIGGADSSLPGSATGNQWASGYDIAQQPGARSAVLRVPGEAQSIGRLGIAETGTKGRLTQ